MPSNRLFIDETSDSLDFDQLILEAKPIALILLVFGAAVVTFYFLADAMSGGSTAQRLFIFAQDFARTLGGFVAFLYVLVRAIQLSSELDVDVSGATGTGSESGQTQRHEVPVTDGSSAQSQSDVSDSSGVDDATDSEDDDDENEDKP